MNRFVVCLMLALVGCVGQSYTSTKVGPDRFVVTSQGHDAGPENFSVLLQKAYETCTAEKFADYSVMEVAHETRRVVAFIRCEKEKQEPKTVSASAPETNNQQSSIASDLEELYNKAKKKVQESMKE